MTFSKRARLPINIGTNWLSSFIGLVISFVILPLLVENLSKGGYGIWVLIMSATKYFAMLDLGIGSSIKRYVSMYDGKNDYQSISEILSSALTLLVGIGLISAMIGVVIAQKIPTIFEVPDTDLSACSLTFLIVCIGISLRFPLGMAETALNAFQRYDITSLIDIFCEILRAVLILIFLKLGFGLLTIGLLYTSDLITRSVMEWFFLLRRKPLIRIRISLIRRDCLMLIKNYSLVSFGALISGTIYSQIDILLTGVLFFPRIVSFYSIAKTFISHSISVLWSINTVFIPIISKCEGANNVVEIGRIWLQSLKLCLCIGGLIFVMLFNLGGTFIDLWLGPDFALSKECVKVLSFGILFGAISAISTPLFFGMGKHYFVAYLSLFNIILSLPLIFALYRPFGIVGVAYSMTIANCMTSLIRTIIACKIQRISFIAYISACFKMMLVLCSFFLFSMAFSSTIEVNSYMVLLLLFVSQLIPYFLCCYFIGIDKKDRAIVKMWLGFTPATLSF
jgi:O-antigen/teichoic acid export membrane protein